MVIMPAASSWLLNAQRCFGISGVDAARCCYLATSSLHNTVDGVSLSPEGQLWSRDQGLRKAAARCSNKHYPAPAYHHYERPLASVNLAQERRNSHYAAASLSATNIVLGSCGSNRCLSTAKRPATQGIHGATLGPRMFQVVEFTRDGLTVEHRQAKSACDLGLHPRDVSLFVSDNRLMPQRATITVRDGTILFRTEAARALITADKAVLFKSRRDSEFKQLVKPMMNAVHAQVRLENGEVAATPFELTVLEILLHATCMYFDRRMAHLAWMVDTVLSDFDVNKKPFSAINESMIQQLVPLEKVLTSVRNDVTETQDAINKILEDDDLLLNVCLSHQHAPSGGAHTADASVSATNASASRGSEGPTAASAAVGGGGEAQAGARHWDSNDNLSLRAVHAMSAKTKKHGGTSRRQRDQREAAQTGGVFEFVAHDKFGYVVRQPLKGGSAEWEQRSPEASEANKPAMHKAPRPSPRAMAVAHAARILETYEREVASLAAGVMEMEENLDTARETWGMQLDSARNHIILMNLYLTTATISVMLAAIMPAFFGMNIAHGLPDTPEVFWGITGGSLLVAVASYPLGMYLYRHHWRHSSAQEVKKLQTLRLILVQHLDDLDEILDACRGIKGPLNRQQFQERLMKAMPHTKLTKASMDMLFTQFDTNRDGMIGFAELVQRNMSLGPLGTTTDQLQSGMASVHSGASAGAAAQAQAPFSLGQLGKYMRWRVEPSLARDEGESGGEPWQHPSWGQHQVRVQQDTEQLLEQQRAFGAAASKESAKITTKA